MRVAAIVPEAPELWRKPALPRVLPLLVVPISAVPVAAIGLETPALSVAETGTAPRTATVGCSHICAIPYLRQAISQALQRAAGTT